ncbi:threonine--tRNA ligase [Myxococcota bacterium]|nr:threonine--tRNA ligase [Myxococcota bacterium]
MLDSNDHRQLGQRLDLFHFQEEAPGMVFWHPRGLALFRALEEAVRRRVRRDGFLEVRTPQLLRQSIWEKSGHWQSFRENMFVLDDEDHRCSAMKPVSCPGHIQIAERMALSHRDLPLRLAELGLCHRNEPSGSLFGLFRLRQFTQDDGHIFCAEDQVASEIARFCDGLRALYASLGFDHFDVALSTRPAVRAGNDEVWDRAEHMLADAARGAGLSFEVHPGEGAFYGPKLELVLADRLGRAWQCGTIQLDLVLPERFDLSYVAPSGEKRRPVMLHRALFGSVERFLGILLEHYAGALPAWLAPDQVIVAPVADAHGDYAREVHARLVAAGLRAGLDARNESLARRVAEAHEAGAPFFVAVGARNRAERSMTLRDRSGAQRDVALDEGVRHLVEACAPPA